MLTLLLWRLMGIVWLKHLTRTRHHHHIMSACWSEEFLLGLGFKNSHKEPIITLLPYLSKKNCDLPRVTNDAQRSNHSFTTDPNLSRIYLLIIEVNFNVRLSVAYSLAVYNRQRMIRVILLHLLAQRLKVDGTAVTGGLCFASGRNHLMKFHHTFSLM